MTGGEMPKWCPYGCHSNVEKLQSDNAKLQAVVDVARELLTAESGDVVRIAERLGFALGKLDRP